MIYCLAPNLPPVHKVSSSLPGKLILTAEPAYRIKPISFAKPSKSPISSVPLPHVKANSAAQFKAGAILFFTTFTFISKVSFKSEDGFELTLNLIEE